MKNTLLNATLLTALNLKDDSSEVEFNTAIQNLMDKANSADVLAKDLADKTSELLAVKKQATAKEVQDLVDAGIAAKKLTKNLADKLAADYAENPKGLKSLIDEMPAQISVLGALSDFDGIDAKYEGKSWDDLYASDELETVRQKLPDLYEKLRVAKYPN